MVAKETTSNKDKVQGRAKGDRANTMTDKDYFTLAESHRIRKVGLLLLIPFVLGMMAVVASLILGSGMCNRDELYRNNEIILNRPSNNYDKDDDDDTAKEVSFTKSTADAYLEPVDIIMRIS
jgi:hypothetical protein